MKKPVISLFASAVRPSLWMETYNQIALNNTIPFEIVFVGNVKPDFDQPENFYYIYSDAKTPQCYEIASRNCKGEYVMFISDDLIYSPNFLSRVYWYARRMQNSKAIVFSLFGDVPEGPPLDCCADFAPDAAALGSGWKVSPTSPVLGVAATVKRSAWELMGGLDRRFTNLWSDIDLWLRFFEAGGHPFLIPGNIIWEKPHSFPRLSVDLDADLNLLNKLWRAEDGGISQTRLLEFQPFTTEEIPIVR